MTIETLLQNIHEGSKRSIDTDTIQKAYTFAEKAHKGQHRKSGEPYIQHPLHVANTLAKLHLDTASISAALLHDVLEDTQVTPEQLESTFGTTITTLVQGVTKLNTVELAEGEKREYAIENLRKMFLAMAEDIRVVVIKLADRYHNMLTIDALSPQKQKRIAEETLRMYAPLANRLGIGELRSKLEDLAFPIIQPKEAEWARAVFQQEIEKKQDSIGSIQADVEALLRSSNIPVEDIHGRVKGLYSLYKKLIRYNKNINTIYDVAAIRIILPDIPSCYSALGLLHNTYKPLVGRIKDYISVPKPNGYQSLHTTVVTPRHGITEFQLRTPEMHKHAEYGVIANWHYNEQEKPKEGVQPIKHTMDWVQQLAEWQKDIQSSTEFEERLQIDVFKHRIFVFTPTGDVLDLPEGATAIDFAYTIHTNVGNTAKSCRINRKDQSLTTPLKNGDVVEILTHPNNEEHPQRSWLQAAKTSSARRAIRNWLRKANQQDLIKEGRMLLNTHITQLKNQPFEKLPTAKRSALLQTLNRKTEEDLFLALGRGDLSPRAVVRHIFTREELIRPRKRRQAAFGISYGKPKIAPRAWIEGQNSFVTHTASDCKPTVGHPIQVKLQRGKKHRATIHEATCTSVQSAHIQPTEQVFSATWDRSYETIGDVSIKLTAIDRIGMIYDISNVVRKTQHNIGLIHADGDKTKEGIVHVYLRIELHSVEEVDELLDRLANIQGILSIKRIEKISLS